MKLYTSAVLAVCLAGCVANNAPPTVGGRRVTYACDKGTPITVVYNGNVARVERGSGEMDILPRHASDNGFWYESPSHRLRGTGNQIWYATAWKSAVRCLAI
jgi:hypothetical protein